MPYQDLKRDIDKLVGRFQNQADKTRYPRFNIKV